jgi:hypothetical protein
MVKLVLHRQIYGYAWLRINKARGNILFTFSVLGLGQNVREIALGIGELRLLRVGYRRWGPS